MNPRTLLNYLQTDQLDAALEAGLMHYQPHSTDNLNPAQQQLILSTQTRLNKAWAARNRYQNRQKRLAKRLHTRQRFTPLPAQPQTATTASPTPSLPPDVAAILAKARTRAQQK